MRRAKRHVGNMDTRCVIPRAIEQGRLCASHPNLAARRRKPRKKRSASFRIKMCGNFIKQQYGRCAAYVGNKARMGEDQRQEQRLLFPS